jgi:hypothetical protein
MDRRTRRQTALVMLPATVAATLAAAVAEAYVTSDIDPWNLTETTSSAGGGTQYHISTGTDGWVSYRWLDAPTKTTVVSGNSCSDLSLFGSPATIGVNDTGYKALFNGGGGLCFILRGRTASGSGSMSGKNGRVQR